MTRNEERLRGTGTSHGAISVVNAIPSGLGAGIGISLPVSVKLVIILGRKNQFKINNKLSTNHPCEWTCNLFLKQFNLTGSINISINSKVPKARGLKSSSAVQVATALALHDALEKEILDEKEFLNTIVNAARKSNITITGGLDDISACALGGLTITNNLQDKLLLRKEIEERSVLLIVPRKQIFTNKVDLKPTKEIKEIFNEIHKISFKNHWAALTLNGLLYSTLVGINSEPIHELLKTNCLAAGLSGTGPAIAVIPKYDDKDILNEINNTYGEVIKTRITNRGIQDGYNSKIK
ncbi:MAG: shikimate kinase [Candidatus Ranarchaeia archaeon]